MEQLDLILHILAYFAEQANRLVNRHWLILAFYPYMVKLAIDKVGYGIFGILADNHAYAILLGNAFQTRGKIHFIAHHRVGHTYFRTHVADADATAIDAHANTNLRPTAFLEMR